MIVEETGSILDTTADALCVPVNCVGVMGAGLAKAVRERWPDSCAYYFFKCETKMLRPGEVCCSWVKPDPTLIFVATKDHWRQPSQLSWVEQGAWEAREMMRLLNAKSIAIPALGCGLGGLAWEPVRRVIYDTFAPVDGMVHVYPPDAASQTTRPSKTTG